MILESLFALLHAVDAQKLSLPPATRPVIVAVIDTGVDVNHPALKHSLWTNPGETGKDANGRDKATNGIDDDHDGFIDDVHGWNFARNSADIQDDIGHGTHISGLIAAQQTAESAFQGLAAGSAKIMVLKYLDRKNPPIDSIRSTVDAIHYAIKMKAQIINYSAGGLEPSAEEKQAIELARDHGILFVAAAGNEHSDSDKLGYYPADYGLSNILSVTAMDTEARLLPTSNYGRRTVDLATLGKNVLSTVPGGYGKMTGTSQATAVVSAAAARILSRRKLSPQALINLLTKSGRLELRFRGKVKYMTRLSLARAQTMRSLDEDAFDFSLHGGRHPSPAITTFSTSKPML